jgi:hypothetical protein
MKMISTGKLNDAAARYGEHAPMATVCCNACRTCVQTNLIALATAAVLGAGATIIRMFRRDTQGDRGLAPREETVCHDSPHVASSGTDHSPVSSSQST